MPRSKDEPKDEFKTCKNCGKEFSRIRNGKRIANTAWVNRVYCSQKCMRTKNRIKIWG